MNTQQPQYRKLDTSLFDGEPLPFAAESMAAQPEQNMDPAFAAWKSSDNPQTRSAVLQTLRPVIDQSVRAYGSNPAVAAKAKQLALQAVRTYDPSIGPLKTHVQANLRGLQRFVAQSDQAIKIPERVVLDRTILQNAETELEDKLGRPPNNAELADYTGFSYRRLEHIRKASPGIPAGSLRDTTGEVLELPSQPLAKQNSLSLWEQVVYEDMSPRDKFIYDATLGMHGAKVMSNEEIARHLNVSPAAVSQRKALLQRKLDEELLEG